MGRPHILFIVFRGNKVITNPGGTIVLVRSCFVLIVRRLSSLFVSVQTRGIFQAHRGYNMNTFLSFTAETSETSRMMMPITFPRISSFMDITDSLTFNIGFEHSRRVVYRVRFRSVGSRRTPPGRVVLTIFLVRVLISKILCVRFATIGCFTFQYRQAFKEVKGNVAGNTGPVVTPLHREVRGGVFTFRVTGLQNPGVDAFFSVLIIKRRI